MIPNLSPPFIAYPAGSPPGIAAALDRALRACGGREMLAAALGVAPGAVRDWARSGHVPAEHCPTIERLTNGAVKCEDLCPQAEWAYLRGTGAKPPPPDLDAPGPFERIMLRHLLRRWRLQDAFARRLERALDARHARVRLRGTKQAD